VKTLIVGFGNVLLGDDGFGVEVVRRLTAHALPAHVETLDVGIGGMHFVLRLMEGFEAVVIVDAVKGGQPPGTLYVFTPGDLGHAVHAGEGIDPHLAEPLQGIKLVKALGCLPGKITIVGCEPASCELGMGLTSAVHAAVDQAIEKIHHMVVNHGHRH
jgi:hydrogenase maturation protease